MTQKSSAESEPEEVAHAQSVATHEYSREVKEMAREQDWINVENPRERQGEFLPIVTITSPAYDYRNSSDQISHSDGEE